MVRHGWKWLEKSKHLKRALKSFKWKKFKNSRNILKVFKNISKKSKQWEKKLFYQNQLVNLPSEGARKSPPEG